MSDKPKRRWLQFGIGTMLIVVTVAAALTLLVRRNLEWIREREESRKWLISSNYGFVGSQLPNQTNVTQCQAPLAIRVFLEHGEHLVFLEKEDIPADDLRQIALRMKNLFPEAIVNIHDQTKLCTYVFEE